MRVQEEEEAAKLGERRGAEEDRRTEQEDHEQWNRAEGRVEEEGEAPTTEKQRET